MQLFTSEALASPTGGAAVLAVAALAYLLSARIWPWRPCRRCRGGKKLHSKPVFSSGFRMCPRCGGSGRELRPFARLVRKRR